MYVLTRTLVVFPRTDAGGARGQRGPSVDDDEDFVMYDKPMRHPSVRGALTCCFLFPHPFVLDWFGILFAPAAVL